MATDTKNLIQSSDIRTMRKDIQQIKKTGFAGFVNGAEKTTLKIDLKKAIKEVSEKENKPLNTYQDKIKLDLEVLKQNKNQENNQEIKTKLPPLSKENNTSQLQNPNKVDNSLKSQDNQKPPTPIEPMVFDKIKIEPEQKQPPIFKETTKETPVVEQKTPAEPIQSPSLQIKEYLKGIPKISPAIKEKLADLGKTEEKQRKKFMEDVEEWIKKEQNNNSPS